MCVLNHIDILTFEFATDWQQNDWYVALSWPGRCLRYHVPNLAIEFWDVALLAMLNRLGIHKDLLDGST